MCDLGEVQKRSEKPLFHTDWGTSPALKEYVLSVFNSRWNKSFKHE